MLEIAAIVLVAVSIGLNIVVILWVNQIANALNAVGQRVWSLEQRSIARANDPVANAKFL